MGSLPIGTEVIVSREVGYWIILGITALPATSNEDTQAFPLTGVTGVGGDGDNKNQNKSSGNFRNATDPKDLIPGDWAQMGQEGQNIAVLGGGVTQMSSGPLASISTHLLNDKVRIVSRNYEHYTDMGETKILNDDGRVNMSFRGGTDQRSETGSDEERYTVRMDLGAVGDVFNLEFTTPKGQTLFKMHVDADGACELYGGNGINIASGSPKGGRHMEEHAGDSVSAYASSRTETVGSDHTQQIGGNASTRAINISESAGNDFSASAFRDASLSSGRNMRFNVIGPQIPLPGAFASPANNYAPIIPNDFATAVKFDVENGDFFIEVGSLASIPTVGNFLVKTWQGDILHEALGPGRTIKNQSLAGFIENRSLSFKAATNFIPDSVILGGDLPISHVVKWEELVLYLGALHKLLDAHVHIIPSTATAGPFPVIGATAPMAATLPASILDSNFPLFRSITTAVSL
jgi:hypothetical protein